MRPHIRHRGFAALTSIVEPASSKIHIDPRLEARGLPEDMPVLVILHVKPGWKAPRWVSVQEQISPRYLTAEVTPSAFKKLEKDPDIISVSSGQPLSVG